MFNQLTLLTSDNIPYELECPLQVSSVHWYCTAEQMSNHTVFPRFCHYHRKAFSLNVNFFVVNGEPVGGES